jgi:hypothetical protein
MPATAFSKFRIALRNRAWAFASVPVFLLAMSFSSLVPSGNFQPRGRVPCAAKGGTSLELPGFPVGASWSLEGTPFGRELWDKKSRRKD